MNARKLTAEQVRVARAWWRAREEAMRIPVVRVMAEKLGVSHGTLYQIAKGHRYKDVR